MIHVILAERLPNETSAEYVQKFACCVEMDSIFTHNTIDLNRSDFCDFYDLKIRLVIWLA